MEGDRVQTEGGKKKSVPEYNIEKRGHKNPGGKRNQKKTSNINQKDVARGEKHWKREKKNPH